VLIFYTSSQQVSSENLVILLDSRLSTQDGQFLVYKTSFNTLIMIKRLLLFAITVSQASLIQAAEWSVAGGINQEMAYDDNVRMQTGDDKRSSFIYEFLPRVNASYKAGNVQLIADAAYGIEVYTNELEDKRQKINTNVEGSYQTQQVNYALNVSYNNQPARNTAADDTGNFNSEGARTNWSVSPSIAYSMTEQDTLSTSVQYSQSLYSDAGVTLNSQEDNSNVGANIAWGHRWSEQYTTTLSGNVTFYKSDGALRQTTNKSYSVTLGNSYLFNEKWDVYLDAGYRYTDSENTQLGFTVDHTSQGFLINSALNYTGEVLSSGVSFNQSMTPDGNGQLNQRSSVAFNVSYQLTETVSTQLSSSYQKTKSISTLVLNNDRSNITASAAINWKITEYIFLNASYSYRWQDEQPLINAVATGNASSNRIMLTVGYNWQGLTLSR